MRKQRTFTFSAGRFSQCFRLALCMLLGGAGTACAHAALTASDPADGAVLASSPTRLSLTFDEAVSPILLNLVAPDGSRQALQTYRQRDRMVEIEAPGPLSNGTHVLAWRVISQDGHPVSGSLVFSVGAAGNMPPVEAGDAIDWPVRIAIWTGKLFLYAGLFLGVGGVFAGRWLFDPGPRPHSFAAPLLLIGLAAAPASLGFQGLDVLGASIGHVVDPFVWRAGFATSFGRTIVIAALALLLALLACIVTGVTARFLSALALLGIGLSLALSGHASSAEPQMLMRPMVFLHGVAAAFWTGALIPLGLALKRRDARAPAALARFSAGIPYVLVVLVLAGIVLAIVQVETPSALVDTSYGQILLIKLALLACLFALAAWNRWRLTAGVARGSPDATRRLVRSIAVETILVLLIFGAVALWRFTPPPRALAAAQAAPAYVHIHTAPVMADLVIDPGHAGPAQATIAVQTGEFTPLDAKGVTLVLSNPALGIEPLRRQAHKSADGTWVVDGLTMPVAGTWTVRIDVLVSDFAVTKLGGTIDIRR